ncbi:MAG: spermidine/putrescine ABC transporter substrate-binding protein [Elusimicrobiota bacterium]|jgi:spermidine/putrescine transport system substrate-binding protein
MDEDPGLTRRDFLRLGVLAAVPAALSSALSACAQREKERVVNFFNWSAYISKDSLPAFTRDTGIKVNYDVFADEEEMFAKLRSGALGYDLIVATDYLLPRLRAANLLAPVPMAELQNLRNVDRQFLNPPYDPEQQFSVPYLWGTTGIGFNKKLVSKAPTSWKDLWEERYKGRITMLDNARDCISTALLMQGYPETTTDEGHFNAVRDLLLKQKPLLKQYTSSTYIDSLVSGEVALAMAWSGDVLQAIKENPQLDYVIPKEGSYRYVDSMCLMRAGQHQPDAVRLIDYLLRPEIAADIANTVRYASPNAAAKAKIEPALLKDQRVYPPPAVMRKLAFHAPLDSESYNIWNQTWSDIKAL